MLTLKRALGLGVAALGIIVFAVYVMAIVDPEATKAADDGVPFGDPGPLWIPVLGALVSAGVSGLAIWFVFRPSRRQSASSQQG